MKKVLAVVCAVLLAGGAAAVVATRDNGRGEEIAVDVERRLKAGDVAGAEELVRLHRDRLPPGRADYFDALLAFQRGKFEESAAAGEKAFAAAPDDWRAVSILFFACVETKRLQRAYDVVHGYVQAHPEDERGLAVEAQYWLHVRPEQPDPERALALLDRIAALPRRVAPPTDPTAVPQALLDEMRAMAEELRGRTQSAIRVLRDRVRDAPGDADARIQLAEALRRAGDVPRAREELRVALRLAPDRADVLEQLVKLLLFDDDTGEEARPLVRRLLALRPDDPRVQILHARALSRVGNDDPKADQARNQAMAEAIDIYRALYKRPDLPMDVRQEVRRNLAVTLFDFMAGGKDGDYLDEAYGLLAEYRGAGGAMDEQLTMVWRTITERPEAVGRKRRGTDPK